MCVDCIRFIVHHQNNRYLSVHFCACNSGVAGAGVVGAGAAVAGAAIAGAGVAGAGVAGTCVAGTCVAGAGVAGTSIAGSLLAQVFQMQVFTGAGIYWCRYLLVHVFTGAGVSDSGDEKWPTAEVTTVTQKRGKALIAIRGIDGGCTSISPSFPACLSRGKHAIRAHRLVAIIIVSAAAAHTCVCLCVCVCRCGYYNMPVCVFVYIVSDTVYRIIH